MKSVSTQHRNLKILEHLEFANFALGGLLPEE
jgi:hypothetical protein